MSNETPNIRAALSRPPVFGDFEQIKVLKILRQADAENDAKRAEGKSEFRVRVEYSISETITVWAEDESEARELAKESVDVEDGDYDYTVTKVEA